MQNHISLENMYYCYARHSLTKIQDKNFDHSENAQKVKELFSNWLKENESLVPSATFYGKLSLEVFYFHTIINGISVCKDIDLKNESEKCESLCQEFLKQAKECNERFNINGSKFFHPENKILADISSDLTLYKKIKRVVKRLMACLAFSFLIFSNKKQFFNCAIAESKFSNSLDSTDSRQQIGYKFLKEIEKIYKLKHANSPSLFYKGAFEDISYCLHQADATDIRCDTSDVFDRRKTSPYLFDKVNRNSSYTVVEYNEAAHALLEPLANSFLDIRNILRNMNGENGFFGSYRKSECQKLENAVENFVENYQKLYNYNPTMQQMYSFLTEMHDNSKV